MDVDNIYDYCRENNAKELKNLTICKGKEIIYEAEKEDTTPLHEAAFANSIECVKLLINYGADITIKDKKGKTFLECIRDDIFKKEMEDYVHSFASLDIKEPI